MTEFCEEEVKSNDEKSMDKGLCRSLKGIDYKQKTSKNIDNIRKIREKSIRKRPIPRDEA